MSIKGKTKNKLGETSAGRNVQKVENEYEENKNKQIVNNVV